MRYLLVVVALWLLVVTMIAIIDKQSGGKTAPVKRPVPAVRYIQSNGDEAPAVNDRPSTPAPVDPEVEVR